MELDEKTLVKLVAEIIRQLKSEEDKDANIIPSKSLYVVFGAQWEENYLHFLQSIKYDLHRVFIVVTDEMLPAISNKALIGSAKIIRRDEIDLENLHNFITVFPTTTRDTIVKTALCISDTFETKWIENCFTKGQQVILYKSGIQKFTGKEPKSYVKKINTYYEELKSFNIEITDDIYGHRLNEIEINSCVESTQLNQINHPKQIKQTITVADLYKYTDNKKIVITQDDVITPLAKEQARDMGIEITFYK